MDFRLVRFMLSLAFAGRVWSIPLGCSYNGMAYKEGDNISTNEPCLSCTCRRGSLVCDLRVCTDPPDDPAPGCFVVQKADDCCPQLLCEEAYSPNGVELRTTFKSENKMWKNDCFINGSVYAEGSAMASSQLCEYCYCIRGEIKCIKPRCFLPFEGCKAIYQKSSCCPTYYDCRELGVNIQTIQTKNYGCESRGIYYSEGEMIPSANGDKCESCYCMKGKIQCTPIICSMEAFEDCRPLSTPHQCCPTSFACENDYSKISNNSIRSFSNLGTELEAAKGLTNDTAAQDYLSRTTHKTIEASEMTVADEPDTEAPTETSEVEPTTPIVLEKAEERLSEMDNSTFSGFQTTISQRNLSAETFTEETSFETEATSTFGTQEGENIAGMDAEVRTELELAGEKEAFESQAMLDEVLGNASQAADDYDSYDYSEPKLPPSLPNLVIFPFVAADAVIKDQENEGTPKPATHDYSTLERIDTYAVFYNDYFSPPSKTEGGFVPKEPTHSDDSYEYLYLKKNQNFSLGSSFEGNTGLTSQISDSSKVTKGNCFSEKRGLQLGESLPGTGDCMSCVCLQGELVCRETTCSNLKSDSNSSELPDGRKTTNLPFATVADDLTETPDPYRDVIKTKPAPDLSFLGDLTSFQANRQTTKPVTVTYKNVVVDYYPDYLITSTRSKAKIKTDKTSVSGHFEKPFYVPTGEKPDVDFTSKPVDGFYSFIKSNHTHTTIFASTEHSSFSETTIPVKKTALEDEELAKKLATVFDVPAPSKKVNFTSTTTESSFIDKFLKSFLTDDIKSTTSRTKHKYSSKIKAQTMVPKSTAGDVTEKEKIMIGNRNSSSSSYSLFDLFFDPETSTAATSTIETTTKPKIHHVTQKPTKGDDHATKTLLSVPSTTTEAPKAETEIFQILESQHGSGDEKKEKQPDKNSDGFSSRFAEGSGSVKQATPTLGSLFKLAGCNIYGRMYRVGKIIAELSGPCMECLCTDRGVHCVPLDC